MLQHITPLAYGGVKLSVVHFHHLSLTCLFLKTKQPFLQLTLLHPIVFEILKNMESSSHNALIKITKITKESTSITALCETYLS